MDPRVPSLSLSVYSFTNRQASIVVFNNSRSRPIMNKNSLPHGGSINSNERGELPSQLQPANLIPLFLHIWSTVDRETHYCTPSESAIICNCQPTNLISRIALPFPSPPLPVTGDRSARCAITTVLHSLEDRTLEGLLIGNLTFAVYKAYSYAFEC